MKRRYALYFFLPFIIVSPTAIFCQQNVLTQHNDIQRTGWNNRESILTIQNVKPGTFGKIFTRTVDDQIYAQPLIITNLAIPGVGVRNLVIVATVNNSVYAFDADSASVNNPYWKVNLSPAGTRPPKNTDMTGACGGNYRDFSGNMGIVGTPVIDSSTGTLFLVSRNVSLSNSNFQQWLHALDIKTGAEKPGSPVLITATYTGSGAGSVGGRISFDPQRQNQRSALLLLNDKVYINWSSHCDWGPYHGWVLAYDKTNLAQKLVYNATPEGYNGGIWMSGNGPAADENGNIYLAVGNGSVGLNNQPGNIINRSESALKLTPSANNLMVSSFFSPVNIAELEAGDLDFGVTQMLLIPSTNRVITSCKDGKMYLMDRDNMGGYSTSSNNVIQAIDLGSAAHLRSSLTYYKGQQNEYVYVWSENSALKALPYNRNAQQFDLANQINSGSQGPTGNNGGFLSLSSNGSNDSTAILWASFAASGDANQSVRPGVLKAFMASDVTKELWNSSTYPNDNPGNYAKFNCPTISNGKVYLGTFSNSLVVYGLTGTSLADTCTAVNIALNKAATASSADPNLPPSAAVDGNDLTRWGSNFSDPQWISVDLGARYDICRVVLKWETALGKNFSIQVSDDAIHWIAIANLTGNVNSINDLPVKGSGRYVRMYGTTRGTAFGYSLYEFEVYGRPSSSACSQPTGLTASNIYQNSALLQWTASGGKYYNLQYKTASAADWTTLRTDSTALTLNGLACGTDYLYQVQTICSTTDSGAYSLPASFSTLSCDAQCGPLPTRWTTQDVGNVNLAGSACYSNDTFDLKGSGDDIWNNEDAFRFAFKTLAGDGEISARVLSIDHTDPWNKAGIMFRESFEPGSRNAYIALTSGNGITYQYRNTTDGLSSNTSSAGILAPYWIKLTKLGSTYAGFSSVDGSTWTQLGDSIDLGFGNGIPVYAGFAITSHNNGVLSESKLDQYLLSGISEFQLQQFSANLTLNNSVEIGWVTSLEMNVQYFVVERSKDNIHYADLDTVSALNNGNFTENYESEDNSPFDGANYYRLKIVKADGSFSYSAPAFVRVNNQKAPLVYPNPAKSNVFVVKGEEAISSITIYDVMGRVVGRISNITSTSITIPVNPFANGSYILSIKTSGGDYKVKLIVNN